MGCTASSQSVENDRDAVGGLQRRNSAGGNASYADQADEAAAMLEGGGSLTSQLQLSISCQNLLNLDRGSLSDPFTVIWEKNGNSGKWREIARTEAIANNLNPRFVTLIPVTYRFEEVQTLRFDVYDVAGSFTTSDTSGLNLRQQTLQGSAECALAQIVGGRDQSWMGSLMCPALPTQRATIRIRAEKVNGTDAAIILKLRAVGVGKGGGSSARHFLRIARSVESGAPVPCYKTEVRPGADPAWAEINGQLRVLANGDTFRPLIIECWRYADSGRHEYIGAASASMGDMVAAAPAKRPLPLVNEAETGGAYANSGTLMVDVASIVAEPTFFDYVAGGMQLDFIVGIDYTASNGDPSHPDSLHYRGNVRRSSQAGAPPMPPPPSVGGGVHASLPAAPDGAAAANPYAAAIVGVGSVLEFYDSDKRFAVLGFGGCPAPRSPPLHAFPVNGSEEDPTVFGVTGVLEAYYSSLDTVTLSGPTLFAPLVTRAASVAASRLSGNSESQRYTVLLIITDGLIGDMAATTDAIVAAADLPFSIIIVGVGSADFSAMKVLDGDDVRLTDSSGRPAARDIVQFVPMHDVAGKGPHTVAREVLAEVPGQVLEYMKGRRIPPGTRRRGSSSVHGTD